MSFISWKILFFINVMYQKIKFFNSLIGLNTPLINQIITKNAWCPSSDF